MKVGWAPWRIRYILGKKERGCIFCNRVRRRKRGDYILHRGAKNFVIMNAFPYNNGHLMVVPYRHTGRLEALGEAEAVEMHALVKQSVMALRRALKPEGFNIGMNVGRPAGAGITDHLHMHVVPRWTADTNFMPVLGETRFMVEYLEATYRRLKKAWRTK